MFNPSQVTITNAWLATKEQALKEAGMLLKQITGFVKATMDDNSTREGSAFFFSSTFHLLTAAHVVHGAKHVTVTYPDTGTFTASIVRADVNIDLALLLLEGINQPCHALPFMKLAPECAPGSVVFCAGFFQSRFHCTDGMVANSDDLHTIVATNLTNHGTSGGPAVGRQFRNLYGVIREDYGTTHHRTAIIPAFDVEHFLKQDPNGPQIDVFRWQEMLLVG